MKFPKYSFVLVFLFFFVVSCYALLQTEEIDIANRETSQLTNEDIAAIKKTWQGYMQACIDGDWDLATTCFTEDAIRMPKNAPAEQGSEAIRLRFEAVDRILDWNIHSLEIDGECGIAYVRSSYTESVIFKGRTEPFSETGKWLCVLRKQRDGSWLFIMDIWNSDAPIK